MYILKCVNMYLCITKINKNMKKKVISILNQKGGCGKTTLATNVAHSFLIKGYKTLLVDSDPQGSAREWGEVNEGKIVPIVVLDKKALLGNISEVSNGYDIVIIDGAPSIVDLSVAAMKVSDIVLIPVQPSPYDIWATEDLVDIIKTRQEIKNGSPKTFFVISRAIKNTKSSKEVIEALDNYKIPILKSSTTQRIIYPTTANDGLTVFSLGNDNVAANEINEIVNEIIEVINGIKS
jgi:chromosome partitioning protein